MQRAVVVALLLGLGALAPAARAAPARSIDDYRHFRALSIDLNGRIPTRAELAQFESDGFDLDAWIDSKIGTPAYADRITRIYLDALRLQIGTSFQFVPGLNVLRRYQVNGPDGSPIWIYFRQGQRRGRIETDGVFCLTLDETGQQYPANTAPTVPDGGAVVNVSQAVLDANTVLVSPWWLYADYKTNPAPTDHYDPATWPQTHPGFVPASGLLFDGAFDGGTPMVQQVRICKEEAQTADTGTVLATGRCTEPPSTRPGWCSGGPPPYGRLSNPPKDSDLANRALLASKATPPVALPKVDCGSKIGFTNSAECGCGVGLERCTPGAGFAFENPALVFGSVDPLGSDQPVDAATQAISSWQRLWWGEEAARFLNDLFANDRPFGELLTARRSFVNGPLAQFYKSAVASTCCDAPAVAAGLLQPEWLLDPKNLPSDLGPHAVNDWRLIADRGPHASGILTMPVFLTKYGSRRARAHVLYQAFLCRDFTAPNLQLKPSTNPNLMERDGCMACHVKLEPMAAYFTRIPESDWSWLPADRLPLRTPGCRLNPAGTPVNNAPDGGPYNGKMFFDCTRSYYDPAFGDPDAGTLRGGYPDIPVAGKLDGNGSPLAHADLGPQGLAAELIGNPEFGLCVAQRIAEGLLGRPLTRDDDQLQQDLADAFTQSGSKTSAVVRALFKSDAYMHSNNLSSSSWRDGGK